MSARGRKSRVAQAQISSLSPFYPQDDIRYLTPYSPTPYGRRTVFSHGFLAADFNGDGTVDDADYTIYGDSYGDTGLRWFEGDGNGDGVCNDAEYSIWADQYGDSVPTSAGNDPHVMQPRLESFRGYWPWGDDKPSLCDVGHQGLLYDREIDGYYNRMRMYLPRVRRFAQRDPIGYADGLSLYQYVGGRPIGRVDPRGTSLKAVDFRILIESVWSHDIQDTYDQTLGFAEAMIARLEARDNLNKMDADTLETLRDSRRALLDGSHPLHPNSYGIYLEGRYYYEQVRVAVGESREPSWVLEVCPGQSQTASQSFSRSDTHAWERGMHANVTVGAEAEAGAILARAKTSLEVEVGGHSNITDSETTTRTYEFSETFDGGDGPNKRCYWFYRRHVRSWLSQRGRRVSDIDDWGFGPVLSVMAEIDSLEACPLEPPIPVKTADSFRDPGQSP